VSVFQILSYLGLCAFKAGLHNIWPPGACAPSELFLRPTRALSGAENVAKICPRNY